MGLDLSLGPIPCKTCGHKDDGFSGGYTYNMSPIWYVVYPDDEGMIKIDGMTGEEALPKLTYARDYMITNKQLLRKLEPSNGWGSYDGFLSYINDCIQACVDYPKSRWEACR